MYKALYKIYAPHVSTKTVWVTSKLYGRRIRKRKQKIRTRGLQDPPVSTRFPIWIDAICINQQDNEEKDHQVQHMGEIYRNAKLVVVWLGPSKDNSNLAMQSIPALSRTMRTIPFEIPNTELHSYDLPRERNPI
jgi:hypothetical protein